MFESWTYDDIRKDIELARKIVENEKNSDKKSLYKFILDKSEEEVFASTATRILPKTSLQSNMFDLKMSFIANNRYYNIIDKFGDIINQQEKIYNNCCDIYLKLPKRDIYNITDKKCIDMVSNVFFNIDDKISKLYSEFYKNINYNVRFSNKEEEFTDNDGTTIYVGLVDKCYILVKDEKGIAKPINLAHEIGHMLSYKLNSTKMYNRKDEFLTEVPALFFEMVFDYECASKYDSLSTSVFNLEKYYFIMDECDKILNHEDIINEWTNNNYEINTILYNNLKDKYNISRNDFIDYSKSNLDYNGKYVIGYIVALNLFHIYKEDKNFALMLLRTMLNMQEKDTYLVINHLINYDYVNEELDILLNGVSQDIQKKLTLR